MVTRREKVSYGLYFLGQNIFYGLVGYMTTYFTDIGIAAVMVAFVALLTKVWDAVNDPIFGALMDKIKFKKGKFVPWLRISLVAIPVATVLLFAVPSGIPMAAKAVWAAVAYMLWDTAYTICDVPIFGLVTTMTGEQKERFSLNSIGRFCAIIAGIVIAIVIPLFRRAIGGWTATVVLLSVIAVATMIPICFFAKERVVDAENGSEKEEEEGDYSIKDMVQCVAKNKYLLIYFSAFILMSITNVGASWGIYVARYCLGGEEKASLVTMAAIVPTLLGAVLSPILCKKIDKFKVFYGSYVAGVLLGIVKFIAGYQNFGLFLVLSSLGSIPGGVGVMLMYQFTPDCYEYGQYKTGLKVRGMTFAAQTFFLKLSSALATAISTFSLTFIGFVEGENAVQAPGFEDKLWLFSCWGGIIGSVLGLIVLRFYKLNDHDVQLMARCNTGEITREEAQAQMRNTY